MTPTGCPICDLAPEGLDDDYPTHAQVMAAARVHGDLMVLDRMRSA